MDLERLAEITTEGFKQANEFIKGNTAQLAGLLVRFEVMEDRISRLETRIDGSASIDRRIAVLEDRSNRVEKQLNWATTGVVGALVLGLATVLWRLLEHATVK